MKRTLRGIIIVVVMLRIFHRAVSANSAIIKAENEVYNHMINRDSIFYFLHNEKDGIELLQKISQRDDYLERSISAYKIIKTRHIFRAEIDYRTSKEEEDFIAYEIKKIVNNLIDERMSTEEKIKAVNDYIVKIYKYDEELQSDNVYTALKSKKAICQGYSMTAYKMFKEIGIDCRIINGDRDGTSHSWNLVKLNNVWYHLDITNNDNIIRDKYLLKSDNFMREHKYTWNKSNYPSALTDYFRWKSGYIDYENDNEKDIEEYYEGGKWYEDENGRWHYKRNSGYEVVGWFKNNDKWYYFDDDGIMQTGWITSEGNSYYMNSDGTLAEDITEEQ